MRVPAVLLAMSFALPASAHGKHTAPAPHAKAKPASATVKRTASTAKPAASNTKPAASAAKPAVKARLLHAGSLAAVSKKPLRDDYPAVALYAAQVGESLGYRPYDARGHERRDAVRELEHLLRSGQTGARHAIHPRLQAALYAIGRHFAGHRIEIFSGYRPRAYCDRAHSRHMTGSAIDFHVDGVDNGALVAYLKKAFHPAGIGVYPHGVHVHLDVERQADTYWTAEEAPPRQEQQAGLSDSHGHLDLLGPPEGPDASDAPERTDETLGEARPLPRMPEADAEPAADDADDDAADSGTDDDASPDDAPADEHAASGAGTTGPGEPATS